MPNLNPQDARTYNPAPTQWKYDPQTNILWLKLVDASSNTSWSRSTSTSSRSQSTTPAQPDLSTGVQDKCSLEATRCHARWRVYSGSLVAIDQA
jgi:hypothetical protein